MLIKQVIVWKNFFMLQTHDRKILLARRNFETFNAQERDEKSFIVSFPASCVAKRDRSSETKASAINPKRESERERESRSCRITTQKGLLPRLIEWEARAETRLRRNRRVEAKRGIIRI